MASLIKWLKDRKDDVVDVVSANTQEDQRKRLAAGQPRSYAQQQQQLRTAKPNASIAERLVAKNPAGAAIAMGLGRSLIGGGQALSGLYDLATPGTGTNRFSKTLDTAAKQTDQTAKRLTGNSNFYKLGQGFGDAAQLVTGSGIVSMGSKVATKAPVVGKAVPKVVPAIERGISTVTKPLTASTKAPVRITGNIAKGILNPRVTASNVAQTAYYQGQEASRGRDISPVNTGIQFGIGQVGVPVAGAIAREIPGAARATVRTGQQVAQAAQPKPIREIDRTLVNYQKAYDVETNPARKRQINRGIAELNAQRRSMAQGGYIGKPDPMDAVFAQNPLRPAVSQAPRVDAAVLPRGVSSIGKTSQTNTRLPLPKPPQLGLPSVNTRSLPEFNTKKVSGLDKAFRSTRSVIERQGKSGQELAGKLQGARDTQEIYLAELQKQMPTVTKLARKDRTRVRGGGDFENFVEATQGKAKPNNPMVAQAVSEWQATHPQIRNRAVSAGLDVGDLGPNYYPHFIDYDKVFKDKNTYNQAINHLVESGQAGSSDEAIKLLGYARDVSRNREFGNLEASRIVDLPFYDKTPNSLISYLSGSTRRIANTETFGKGDEQALKLITKIGLEGGDTEAAKSAFDVAVGAKNYSPGADRITGRIRKYTTTTRLGLGALTNVSQSVNTGVVTGHLRTMGAMLKQLDPKTREFAQDAGVISDALLNDLRSQQGYKSFTSKVLGNSLNKITAPGFGAIEKFNRSVAATAGRDYALRLAQKGDESALRKLGVTGAIKNGTLTEYQQIQAARKIVEKTQFKVDPQDLPGWADSPGGKLVAQFRTFSYNQSKFFSNEILKPAAKGNLLPLSRVLAALPVGYGLYEVRRAIDGRPEEENKTKVGLQAFSKIGGAGLVFDIYQGLNPIGSQYLSPDRRATMASGTVGGPAIGTAIQGVGAVSEAIQRKNVPEDESRLEGKVALGKSDTYTDATSLSRFGLQQVPIVGTPIKNRLLPFKKESEADTGKKIALTKDQQEQFNSLLPEDKPTFLARISKQQNKDSTAVDTLESVKKTQNEALRDTLSKEDYKLSQLSKKERKQLIASGAYTEKKFEGLDNYIKRKKRELGIDLTADEQTIKGDKSGSRLVDDIADLEKEDLKAWKSQDLDTKYQDLYDRSAKIAPEGFPPLPKSNETLAAYAKYLKVKESKPSELKLESAKKDFLKDSYAAGLTDESRELMGKYSNDEKIAAIERRAISKEDFANVVAYDNFLLNTGLSSSAKIGNTIRRYFGVGDAPKKSGSGKGGSGRKPSAELIAKSLRQPDVGTIKNPGAKKRVAPPKTPTFSVKTPRVATKERLRGNQKLTVTRKRIA